MNKFERRQFFERLCALRDGYRYRGPADTASVMSVTEALVYAGALFEDPQALDLLLEARVNTEAQRLLFGA